MTLLARFDALDRLLVAHGFPPTSPWWRKQLERFLKTGRRRWVLRVGRRGGKSSTLCRLAVVVALWGDWVIPPGDTAVIAIVSVDREEASKRLLTIESILSSIGIKFERRGQQLDIPERRATFSVRTCSTSGTIGFTSVMIWGDEAAHWESRDTAANPAKEVMASLRPTMATQPTAFEVMCSAPWGKEDYHCELMNLGDTQAQVTATAATWEANPTITEERTHELEPDENEWKRAYAAIPSETITNDWFGLALDRAIALPRCIEGVLPWVEYTIALDPAFARDHFGWAVVSSRSLPPDPRTPERERRMTRIHAAGAWRIGTQTPTDLAIRVREELAVPWHLGRNGGPAVVYTDQFEGFSFSELARQAGIVLHVTPWTGGSGETSQLSRYKAFRLAMLEGCLQLPDVLHSPDGPVEDGLARELRRVSSTLLPSGGERIELPRTKKDGHMDSVSATVLAVSMALERTPQAEWTPQPTVAEDRPWRDEAIRAVDLKRRREWRKPEEAMRNAMRRIG